ncbi:MAG: EamA family transporter [Lentisphaeria bacterium]|nr:EamA family transporter [Lentisphaeria bacterium]
MSTTLLLGIAGGLVAAFMQSCSYLGGRRFLATCGNSLQLLVSSLIICGAAAWIMAIFLLDTHKIFSWQMAGFLTMCNGGFIAGQWGFFNAQKHIESSRIASLLGLKVLVVMLLAMIFLREKFVYMQYLAVAIAATAAMLMNWNKGKLDWNGMGFLFVALLGYAVSDLGVQQVVREISSGQPVKDGVCGFILSYGTMGILALMAVKPCNISRKMLKGAFMQAGCWIVSMWGLYISFGLIGASFGNVVQASRGVISLLLGIILSRFAINGLEQKQSVAVWLRKAAAALLMFGAIVLYALVTKG